MLLAFISVLGATALRSQVPQGITYQAVLRDGSALLTQTPILVEFAILRGNLVLYTEQHSLQTNDYGLLSAVVGDGTPLSGTFATIDWSIADPYYLRVTIDRGSGSEELGQTRLVAVPYSFYAARAATVDPLSITDLLDVSGATPQTGQVLTWDGSTWAPQPLPAYSAGAGIQIAGQTISNTGDTDAADDITTATSASGDLAGTYPGPGVVALRGRPVAAIAPAGGQVLKWSGQAWMPGSDSVGINHWSLAGTTISYGGEVGVGTSSVAPYALRVEGSLRINKPLATPLDGVFITANTTSNSYASLFASNTGVGPAAYFSASTGAALVAQGRVGIGTNAPTTLLDLNVSSSTLTEGLRINNASTGDALIRLATGGTDYFALGVDNSDGDKFKIAAGNQLTATPAFTLLSNGRAGFGTANPPTQLSVVSGFAGLNSSGSIRYYADVAASGAGIFETRGASGIANVQLTSPGGFPNHGSIAVLDANGISQAGMLVDAVGQGLLFADQKNFRIPHPEQPDKDIWYGSLEGPELAVYVRGTATLQDGYAVVIFPAHYLLVANLATMTVVLTPLSAASEGLAVVEKRTDGFVVRELRQGQGNYAFDWEVKCVRKGKEDYEVIRDRNYLQPERGEGGQ
ncbi:MAG: hypothetical protein OHK0039_26670 [Bacteroidia bacterium]